MKAQPKEVVHLVMQDLHIIIILVNIVHAALYAPVQKYLFFYNFAKYF